MPAQCYQGQGHQHAFPVFDSLKHTNLVKRCEQIMHAVAAQEGLATACQHYSSVRYETEVMHHLLGSVKGAVFLLSPNTSMVEV